ncbi:hypothetical protein FG386_003624 [Cryptosporidium ryanae]|uniref:uncharacterized protein n=1 Tax=Cryptosporidium ryanae TaxID=515981 RepID=UPI00351A0493|nr:hypothetical protein FG386_003624 [Cryptosporidium ryanae]
MLHLYKFVICFFFFKCLETLSHSSSNENSFWRTQINALLTIDRREPGVSRLISIEESNVSESNNDENLEFFNNSKLIELVVTNDDGEEVTLFVSMEIYNAMYSKVELRRNPNTFASPNESKLLKKDETNEILIVSDNNETKPYVINKYHSSIKHTNLNLPIFLMSNFESTKMLGNFTDLRTYLPLRTSNESNFTNTEFNYTCNQYVTKETHFNSNISRIITGSNANSTIKEDS